MVTPTAPGHTPDNKPLSFQGTVWIRKSDGIEVAVVTDSDPTSLRYKRQLRLKDTATGRHFWGTPERLRRTFHPVCSGAEAVLEAFPWPARSNQAGQPGQIDRRDEMGPTAR